jgi:hypothetical protein
VGMVEHDVLQCYPRFNLAAPHNIVASPPCGNTRTRALPKFSDACCVCVCVVVVTETSEEGRWSWGERMPEGKVSEWEGGACCPALRTGAGVVTHSSSSNCVAAQLG